MKKWIGLLLLATIGLAVALEKQNPGGGVTLYAQVVRGTDEAKPQDPKWKPIGPQLRKRLTPVFRWNHYWEVACHPLTVAKDKPAKARVTADRELEIRWVSDQELEIRLYQNGKLARKTHRPVDAKMTIMGGDRENNEAWFVVIRNEKSE